MDPRTWTNSTKAQVGLLINALLALLPLFGVLTDPAQYAGVASVVNIIGGIFVGTTYKNSPTRIADDASPVIRDAARNP
jgi:hypothetical protein